MHARKQTRMSKPQTQSPKPETLNHLSCLLELVFCPKPSDEGQVPLHEPRCTPAGAGPLPKCRVGAADALPGFDGRRVGGCHGELTGVYV